VLGVALDDRASLRAEVEYQRARAEAAEAALVLACPHCGPEHFAGPDADGACVMCMGTLIRTDAAGAVLAHELYNGAHVVEAALATARAEGAAAERAAVVACLHGGADAHSGFGRSVVAVALRDHVAYIEAGAHVRAVEGA
jgi:aminopeptidase N